jgi:SlyX protein
MENSIETTIQDSTIQALVGRIDNLEMRGAYQDEVIEQLNKVIISQWGKLDQVLARLERLENRVRDAQDNGTGQNAYDEPPPPHY